MDWLLTSKTFTYAVIAGLLAFVGWMIRLWARSWYTREVAKDDRLSNVEQTQVVHAEKHKHHESRDEQLEKDVRRVNDRIDRLKGG